MCLFLAFTGLQEALTEARQKNTSGPAFLVKYEEPIGELLRHLSGVDALILEV